MPAIVAMPQSAGAVAGPSYSGQQVSRDDAHHTRLRSNSRSLSQTGTASHDEDYEGDDGGDDDDDEVGTEDGAASTEAGGQELITETTIKSGYLYKRGEKRKNWKKRWFVLRSSKLFYYKNEKEYQLLRFIDMADVHTVAPVDLKKVEHSFGIVTSKRQYYVRAASAKEMAEWVDALRHIRELVRQRSTLTQDMAGLDVAGGRGAEAQTIKRRGSEVKDGKSTQQSGASTSSPPRQSAQASPISISIPDKGIYRAPAHPRVSAGGTILSPLTATSDSEQGAQSGAEQFGLSYASSTGQSFGSSPGRTQHVHYASGGSPHNASGGDEDGVRRSRTIPRPAARSRDPSAHSSAGEQPHAEGKGQPLSSSDEDGEGDDWDQDEEADRAMPLPTDSSGITPSSSGNFFGGSHAKAAPAEPSAAPVPPKPKVGPEFFKDQNKIIHQGYLMKQSSRRKTWRKRWFTLTCSHLSYSRSHMDARAHRQIPLTSILDAIEYTSKKPAPISSAMSPTLGSSSGSANAGSASGSVQPSHSSATAIKNALSPSRKHHAAETSGGDSAAGAAGTVGSPQSANAVTSPIAERRTGTTPSISLGSAPSFMSMPGAMGALTTPGGPGGKRKKENCFKIITPKRTFLVGAPTEEDELKWLSALQALLAHFRESQEGGGSSAATGAAPVASAATPAPATGTAQQPPTGMGASSPPNKGIGLARLQMPSVSVTKPLDSATSQAPQSAQSSSGASSASTPATAQQITSDASHAAPSPAPPTTASSASTVLPPKAE